MTEFGVMTLEEAQAHMTWLEANVEIQRRLVAALLHDRMFPDAPSQLSKWLEDLHD